MKKTLLIGAALLLPAAAFAQEIKPGLWQYTVSMNIPGMPAGAHNQSFQRCVTPKEVQDKSAYMRSDSKSQCKMSDFKQQGRQFSYNVTCKGDMSMTGKVSGSTTPDSMNVDTEFTMSPPVKGMGTMKQTMSAKRIGECKG